MLHGDPVDRLACSLLDMHDPAGSAFLRLIGPPGAGKSQIARAIAHRLWTGRGRAVSERHGIPFYGFVEMQPGPSSDEYFFRYDYVPVAGAGGQVTLVDSAFVQAMREGWVVMIDEVNTARDVCLLSINATLDGRLTLYLTATGETVSAQPGFAVLLAYNPGLVGATDIPDAWHSRFPATLEVTSNWAALAELGAPQPLVAEALRLDRQRSAGEDGLSWTPQFRDIEALWRMIERVGERPALAFFASNLFEQVQAGRLQDADAAAACRMLDLAGNAHLSGPATGGRPTFLGYRGGVPGLGPPPARARRCS
jgi:MoxR-like ATPase